MPGLSARAYAKHRGVSHVAVLKALRDGRISKDSDGRIDPAQADLQWAENTDQMKPRNSVSGDPRRRRRKGEAAAPMMFAGPQHAGSARAAPREEPSITTLAQARLVLEAYKARMAKLEYELAEASVVDAEEVRAASFDASRQARDLLIDIPERLGSLLSAPAYEALRKEIAHVCGVLSGTIEPEPRKKRAKVRR